MTSTASADPTFLADIPYLGPDRAEKMDAYLPSLDFPGPRPALLLIHGGGWRVGDKANERERNVGGFLAPQGFAVFSINYLLNAFKEVDGVPRDTVVAWPQNFFDCKSALRFLRRNAERYRIDPNRIGVMGGSAGGTFAMLLGATSDNAALNAGGLYLEESTEVSCIINFYGISDLTSRSQFFAGSTPEETAARVRLASPCQHFTQKTPPILIAHGTADTVVDVDESRSLVTQLKGLGLEPVYLEIPGAPHTFHLQPEQADLRPAVLEFLNRHLK